MNSVGVIPLEIMIYCFLGLGVIAFLFGVIYYAFGVAYQMGLSTIDLYHKWMQLQIELEERIPGWDRDR